MLIAPDIMDATKEDMNNPLKLHIPGHIGILYGDYPSRKQDHGQHPHQSRHLLVAVKVCDAGRARNRTR